MRLLAVLIAASCFAAPTAPETLAAEAQRKFDALQYGHPPAGSVYNFTVPELNAWVRFKALQVVPQGLRQTRLELGEGTATAYGLVDFLKVRQANHENTPWLVARLIEGEKPVKVVAQIQSSAGQATVHLLRVEIGGVGVSGAPLDFLISNFFLPFYPNAKIGEPFPLAGSVDHIEVHPAVARAIVRR